ncbi:ABC-type sugar transport system, periplasmic component [Halobacteroides halobius DSM 5150]|uniref:ABC-type sugar transport system, periplasmic component n=1 Tax=Halobacteroides halobius (strain ATCC 35273 / DSM 5150 / MD-1) TaxID=748449 RepID=L0KBJ8_HALHC|nr:ABC transporter substrate-binding protein [Halobacteroides halobius]AGB41749.1 ABC-type sugar transport system, periplasmic component [Halobacteroides halobius DSM 5150]
MFKKKSLTLVLALTLLFSLSLTAGAWWIFGNDDEKEQVEIRLSGWSSSPTESKLFEKVIKGFEKENPNINVKYEPIQGSYMDKLQTQLASGTAPDVFYVDSVWLPALASKNVLYPMDKFMKQSGVEDSEFLPGLINGFEYQGKQYGIPKGYSTLGLFYNKRMFKEAGITDVPDTWAELYQVAKKLTKDTDGDGKVDQWGMSLNTSLARFIVFLHQNGEQLLNDSMTKSALDSPEAIKALEFYNMLYQKGYAAQPGDVGAQWLGDALGKDRVGMVVTGNWTIPFMKDQYPEVEYGVAPLPKKKKKSTMAFTVAYSIARRSDHPKAAWKLVKYLTSETGQRKWVKLGMELPSRKELADMDYFNSHPKRKTLMDFGEYAEAWQFNVKFKPIVDSVNTTLQAVFLGEVTPEEGLKEVSDKINEVLK